VQYADPCAEASKASLDCLERAHYNRNEVRCAGGETGSCMADMQCMDYFRAYRECKKNWVGSCKIRRLHIAHAQLDQLRKDKAGG